MAAHPKNCRWLAAQLPLDAEFQLYGFNESVQSYVTDDNLDWQPMSDARSTQVLTASVKLYLWRHQSGITDASGARFIPHTGQHLFNY